MIDSTTPIRLDALRRRVAPVVLPDDTTHPVRAFRAVEYQLLTELRGIDAQSARADEILLELARRALPTASPEQLGELEPDMILVVVKMASGGADEILAAIAAAHDAMQRADAAAAGTAPPGDDADAGATSGNG